VAALAGADAEAATVRHRCVSGDCGDVDGRVEVAASGFVLAAERVVASGLASPGFRAFPVFSVSAVKTVARTKAGRCVRIWSFLEYRRSGTVAGGGYPS
jgi:hypothetical protein